MSSPRPGSATLTDVARQAGVSLATASRALHGGDRRVGDDLQQRVAAAAAALNYTANAQARAMAKGRSNVVGLLVHDIADPYFAAIAAGVIKAAEQREWLVTLASTVRRPEQEPKYVAALRGQRARAVILAGSRVDDDHLQRRLRAELDAFESSGGRAVTISQNQLSTDTVVVENRAGARALAGALAGLGHRRFAVLAGPRGVLAARDRLLGFREGLARAGVRLPAESVWHGEFTREGGREAMSRLLATGLDATCVFAVNDVMALGAMCTLREAGVAVPGEVAIAGFDDINTLLDVTPSLTTVTLPLEQLGASAVDLLAQPPAPRPRLRRVKGEVALRESTPPL